MAVFAFMAAKLRIFLLIACRLVRKSQNWRKVSPCWGDSGGGRKRGQPFRHAAAHEPRRAAAYQQAEQGSTDEPAANRRVVHALLELSHDRNVGGEALYKEWPGRKKRGQGRQSLQDARKNSKKGMKKLKSRRDSIKSRHDSIKSRRDSMESRRDFSFCMPLRQFFRAVQTPLSRGMRKNMRRQGCPSSPVLMLFLSDNGLCWGQTFLVCVLIIPQICSIFHPHKVIISGVLSKFAAVKL